MKTENYQEAEKVIADILPKLNPRTQDKFRKGILGLNAMEGNIKKIYPNATFRLVVDLGTGNSVPNSVLRNPTLDKPA